MSVLGRQRSPEPDDLARAIVAQHGAEAVPFVEAEMQRALDEGDESGALDWTDVLAVIESVRPQD